MSQDWSLVEKNVEIIHNWHRLEHNWRTIGGVQCTAVHCALCTVHWIGAELSLDCKSDWMFRKYDFFFFFFFMGPIGSGLGLNCIGLSDSRQSPLIDIGLKSD